MKVLSSIQGSSPAGHIPYSGLMIGLLALIWPLLQRIIQFYDPALGSIDPQLWMLILLAFGVFLGLLGLVWWLVRRYWLQYGLPDMEIMVSQFNELDSWQQLKFYYAFFALLLLAGIGCLSAIL